jgi:hypothetical protein
MESKYFLRFMNVVSMRRMSKSLQEKHGWNKYVLTIKSDMMSHPMNRLIKKMIESL